MKEYFKILAKFLLICIIVFACSKDEKPYEENKEPDAVDILAGTYAYTLISSTMVENDDMTVSKISANKVYIIRADKISRMFSVVGDTLTEDPGQVAENIVLPGGVSTATFNENATGTISGNNLHLSGVWTNSWDTLTFEIVAAKQ